MAKEEKEKKKKGTEEKVTTKKKVTKEKMKKAHQVERLAILNEKKKIEEKIDALLAEKKTTKDKLKKQELKKDIKELKHQRSRIGKRDTYLSDVMAEMRLVRWPSRTEVIKYSIACLVFVIFFALFFFGFDALFALVKDLID